MEQGMLPGMDIEETVSGIVDSIVFSNADNSYTVFRLKPLRQGVRFTVTMNSAAPLVGQQVAVRGEWVTHPRFGRQFRATSIRIEAPTTLRGIERFLASGVIDGVGPTTAKRIVAAFGEQTLEILEHNPGQLKQVEGIGKKTAEKIAASYQKQSELRDLMIWLEDHGLSGTYAARIFKQYTSFSIQMLEQHPYRLAQEVDGIGFMTADTIAASVGITGADEDRIAAGIDYTLQQIAANGHCCMPEQPLADRAAKLLRVNPVDVYTVLRKQLKRKRLFTETVGGTTLIYPPYLYQAECKTARKILYLQKYAETLDEKDSEALLDQWEAAQGITLAAKQREAAAAVLQHGVFVMTGGPGTGKTTVIRAMLDLLRGQGLEVLLGAPTGRAAKRLAEATGCRAVTVHRMLEAQGGTRGEGGSILFGRDADAQLEADAVILDEVSMMDIVLMQHFLDAVPDGCRVIFVGDVDQLPAVGPGSVLKDILRSGAVPSVRLDEIFRQDEQSTIVLNAHAINGGRVPECGTSGDFVFLELSDDHTVADTIVSLCREELPRLGWDVLRDVQVLSPMHRLECGVDQLNKRLQAALNPKEEGDPEIVSNYQSFRTGDKVMQTKNNYMKHVFNGDIGFICRMRESKVTVRYGEGQEVDYEKNELGELQLAYAMSVHKSQGSEYPVIVLPLVPGHHIMLQRNLLYTAVTRAEKQVILLGSRAALRTAVENDRTRLRYTLLAERLAHKLDS